MKKSYLSMAAALMLLAGCATKQATNTPTVPKVDLTAGLPWPNGKPFYVKAGLLGPVIWESVPPFGATHSGGVAYLVEFLDSDKRTLKAHKGEFETALGYTARENELKVDIGTVVLANQQQMQESLNADPRFNQRYTMPDGAEYVRFTVDPDGRIAERNEANNTIEFRLPHGNRPTGIY